jgi:hypothetical protein
VVEALLLLVGLVIKAARRPPLLPHDEGLHVGHLGAQLLHMLARAMLPQVLVAAVLDLLPVVHQPLPGVGGRGGGGWGSLGMW